MTIEPSTEIEVLPARRPVQSEAIGQLMMHAQAMSAAEQLGTALAGTDLVPATYRGKPGNAAAAILYGAELGLNPIQSLQQIFVVHGAPAIYARTAVALVTRVGIIVETVETSNQSVTVRGTDPSNGHVETSTWDMARAQLAGYTSNKKYQSEPQQMLYAKAAMEVCRRIAPDVLLGIPHSREELEMEEQPTRVRSERGGRGVAGLRSEILPAPAQSPAVVVAGGGEVPAEPGPQPLSKSARDKWVKRMFALLNEGGCTSQPDQLTVITKLAGLPEPREHRDQLDDNELRTVVEKLNALSKSGAIGDYVAEILAEAGPAAPAGDDHAVVMAGESELATLNGIRQAEKYDEDDEWFAFVEAAIGRRVDADRDLTFDEARQIIDTFNEETNA